MSAHPHEGGGPPSPSGLVPWQTVGTGIITATVLGALSAWLIVSVAQAFFETPKLANQIIFWIALFGVAQEVFRNGYPNSIPVGMRGVILFMGKRLRRPLLSEGDHWLPPFVMKADYVDVTVHTSRVAENDDLVSKDGKRMRASYFFVYSVTDPYLVLNVEDVEGTLLKIATAEVREAFTEEDAMVLATDGDVKKGVSSRITAKLLRRSSGYGIHVIEALLERAEPPKEILDARAQADVELAQQQSEKIELDGVIARIKELKALDFSPEKAYEILAAERGKVKTERKIVKVEGVEPIVKAIIDAIFNRS